ncbi:hypothetical protein G4B88_009216 [Cannabis sativa]|uniref:Reverse transcriptase zinc-binding domain-containing protein n=1 Tax=Cannabis sativa TaxID=3483 RepID=A0A7J6G2K9_CANSA|nr:hypothetical protein G4B88_009216 [Cannabis sativa]
MSELLVIQLSGCSKARDFAYPLVGEAVPLYGPWIKASVPIRSCFDTRGPTLIRHLSGRPTSLSRISNNQAVGTNIRDVHGTVGSGAASTGTNNERTNAKTPGMNAKETTVKLVDVSVLRELGSKKRKAVGNVSPILIQADDSVTGDNEVSKTREVGGTFSIGSSSPAAQANNSEKFGNSFVWKGILNARDIVANGSCSIIVNGESIDIWWKLWILWMNYGEFRAVMENVRTIAPGLTCIVKNGEDDFIVWKNSKLGNFSVKGAYWDAQLHRFGDANHLWGWIWNAKVHPHVSMMLWRVCAKALPTGDIFNQPNHNNCCFCGASLESPMDLFARGSFANALWNRIIHDNDVVWSVDQARREIHKRYLEFSFVFPSRPSGMGVVLWPFETIHQTSSFVPPMVLAAVLWLQNWKPFFSVSSGRWTLVGIESRSRPILCNWLMLSESRSLLIGN